MQTVYKTIYKQNYRQKANLYKKQVLHFYKNNGTFLQKGDNVTVKKQEGNPQSKWAALFFRGLNKMSYFQSQPLGLLLHIRHQG